MSLPIYPELKISEQDKVINKSKNFYKHKIIKKLNGIKLMNLIYIKIIDEYLYEIYNKKQFNNLDQRKFCSRQHKYI